MFSLPTRIRPTLHRGNISICLSRRWQRSRGVTQGMFGPPPPLHFSIPSLRIPCAIISERTAFHRKIFSSPPPPYTTLEKDRGISLLKRRDDFITRSVRENWGSTHLALRENDSKFDRTFHLRQVFEVERSTYPPPKTLAFVL